MLTEPANLTEWKPTTSLQASGRLFTCGRPGRAKHKWNYVKVELDTIDRWVDGLPPSKIIHLVSLLGKKPNGSSEFYYYPFRSSKETGELPTMQQWFDRRYGERFKIYEFPTTDRRAIPADTLELAGRLIRNLLAEGNLVVVMDSAGKERTARVCESIGYEPSTNS